jgi:hypothetical protein
MVPVPKDMNTPDVEMDSTAVPVPLAIAWGVTATIAGLVSGAVSRAWVTVAWYGTIVRSVTGCIGLNGTEPITAMTVAMAAMKTAVMAAMAAVVMVASSSVRGGSEDC